MRYSPREVEEEVQAFWKESAIYSKCRQKAKGREFYFLDGPPYTSGKVHIGTAWNKSLKDAFLRYKRMRGFNVWDRAGYDMHGLPIENKVFDKLGFKSKEEAISYGMEKFIGECRKFALASLEEMNSDFEQLGVWMDFENAYMPITREFISGVWYLIKKADEKKRLYKGKKTMQWCAHCATALAKHELEYKTVVDNSIFVKFPVKGERNTYLLIWTTTPWTIPFNLGIMANPGLEYVKAKVGDEHWILAKGLANIVISAFSTPDYSIIETFPGSKLEGTEYIHPLDKELGNTYAGLKKNHPKVHTVVMSTEFVDLSAGSGLVHMAPGCGPEDYEVGRRNNIPAFNNLDEYGVFPEESGKFSGLVARKDDKAFVEALEKAGAIVGGQEVEHDYPFCWRCHNPVIFRATEQWFFKVEDLKEQMRIFNKSISWLPEWGGSKWFDSWLENLRDNSITRQRFWGTPVPIWVCGKCGSYQVIGSYKELKEKAIGEVPEDLHKPWIDEVKVRCSKCSAPTSRVPDVLDVWVDSGTVSWNCLGFPEKQEHFKRLFPADFILEGKDQIRGWFNLLMVSGILAFDKPSFKSVYMHGFVQDAEGEKMSKSIGNVISPQEIVSKYGSDSLRFYMIGAGNPGVDLNFSREELENKFRSLNVLWNLHNFLLDSCRQVGFVLSSKSQKEMLTMLKLEDKAMLSRANSAVKKATGFMEKMQVELLPGLAEELFLSISRDYVQLVRERLQPENPQEREAVLFTMAYSLLCALKMLSIVSPFISEKAYQSLKPVLGTKEESIHLFSWPEPDESLIDEKSERLFSLSQEIIALVLNVRDKIGRGVRWPLKNVTVVSEEPLLSESAEKIKELVSGFANIKSLEFVKEDKRVKRNIRLNPENIKEFDETTQAKIIASVSTMSNETILSHLKQSKSLALTIEGTKISLDSSKFIFEASVDEPFAFAESLTESLSVIVDKSTTEQLEKEGFFREIVRRVQNSRKELKLTKDKKVSLYIQAPRQLVKFLGESEISEELARKTGARKIKVSDVEPLKNYDYSKDYRIKDMVFKVCIGLNDESQD